MAPGVLQAERRAWPRHIGTVQGVVTGSVPTEGEGTEPGGEEEADLDQPRPNSLTGLGDLRMRSLSCLFWNLKT